MKSFFKATVIASALMLGACANQPGSGEFLGTVLGGAAGGAVGNQFGKGNGNVAMTIVGTLFGAVLGNQAGASMDRANRYGQGPAAPLVFTPPPNGTGMMMGGKNSRGHNCREFWQDAVTREGPTRVWGYVCQGPDGSWYFPQEMN